MGEPGVLQSLRLQSQTRLSDWTRTTWVYDSHLKLFLEKKKLTSGSTWLFPQPSIPKQLVFSIFERSPEIRNLMLRHLVSICITESVCVFFNGVLLLLLLLLLLLSHFSRVWLCATPQMAAHQAPPSLGFFRQEYWSGLPFPSPVRESESEVA